jgi:hypothetical protein
MDRLGAAQAALGGAARHHWRRAKAWSTGWATSALAEIEEKPEPLLCSVVLGAAVESFVSGLGCGSFEVFAAVAGREIAE